MTRLLDADEIVPGLWQGARTKPDQTYRIQKLGFTTIVFCANDYQPASVLYPGLKVIHAPFEDDRYLTREDLQTAVYASSKVAERLLKGEKVLVTCIAGINRSGLVCALAMHKAFNYSGRTCIALVREKRKLDDGSMPLRNQSFIDALMKLEGDEKIVLPGIDPLSVL